MASSAWAEVVYLECKHREINHPNASLSVDTETNLVKVGGAELKYTEYGNTIQFENVSGPQRWNNLKQ